MPLDAFTLPADDSARLNLLLNSNEPPNSLDIGLITSSIGLLDQSLFYLQTTLKRFKQERLRYKSLLCGVRKLPPEILSEIFVLCTELPPTIETRDESCVVYPDTTDYPYYLSQVCRRWRDIAHSTPLLWSSISLPHSASTLSRRYDDMIQRCLNLSRQLPLHITITTPSWRKNDLDRMPEILDRLSNSLMQLTTQMSRWRYFEFSSFAFGVDMAAKFFPVIPPSGAPNLIEAYFSDWHHQDGASEAAKWMVEFLKAAPNIRHVEFNTLVPSLKTPDGVLWAHLRVFEAQNGMQIDDLFIVLMSCPSLETLDVNLDTRVDDPYTLELEKEICLEKLQTLTLACIRQDQLPIILQWLTLPALQRLSLEGAGEMLDDDWPHDQFMGLLSRSKCTLEALILRDLSFTETQLISYLQLPNIRDTIQVLEIDQWRTAMSPDMLHMLTFRFPPIPPPLTLPPPSPRILFLPKLKDITFTINAMVQAVSLRHFVASRWYARNDVPPPVACLKRIRVYLAVPYVPNVELAIGPIERVFTRIANGYGRNTGQRTVVELMRHVIRSGLQDQEVYDGIERLDRLPISEWMIG